MLKDPTKHICSDHKELLRLSGVQAKLPLSRSAFYQGIKDGKYPPPIKFGRSSFWDEAQIDALIAQRAGGGKGHTSHQREPAISTFTPVITFTLCFLNKSHETGGSNYLAKLQVWCASI